MLTLTASRLETAYRATTYRVSAPEGEVDLRIDRRSPVLDAVLRLHGACDWAIVSAANPGSRALGEAENRIRHAALRAHVGRLPLPCFPAVNVPDTQDWPQEPSLFVMGLDAWGARALGAAFGQLAVVCGSRGGPVCLEWCGNEDH